MFSADSQNLTAHLIGEKLMKRGIICGGGRLQNVQYFSGFPADDQVHSALPPLCVMRIFLVPRRVHIVKREQIGSAHKITAGTADFGGAQTFFFDVAHDRFGGDKVS